MLWQFGLVVMRWPRST